MNWRHIIMLSDTEKLSIIDLLKELLKPRPSQCSYDEMFDMTEDILEQGDEDRHTTSYS